ncbi:ATP-binding protein [Radiobacillus deserti]|uniref:histidine kinase n=1 Tax=Radiobacillus deserti TaxID=2594883 RepID=A0A516KGI1_9BACI|nr:ATP-binding protein [Radiobacillus deserti]QDP40502.1 cell wall metabolism sensor histidine kinase WalK [Radiobacillus deserti]
MIWRSVVGKLWITILLLVSFVLFILTILLLEFFENFHVSEAEDDLMQSANKIAEMIDQEEERSFILETTSRIMDPSSRVAILFGEDQLWLSETSDPNLNKVTYAWLLEDPELASVISDGKKVQKQITLPNSDREVMIVGKALKEDTSAIFVYQSLNVVRETSEDTTKIILLAAGIAIILTTIFAFFLSTRISSPLIKMREGAFELARGEFNTKVPILTHDEIGELAMAFNRMGRQLKFHINALRQEKEQLSGILSSMADGVITLNRKGDIIVSNPPAQKFLEDWNFEYEQDKKDSKSLLPTELQHGLEEVIRSEEEVMNELLVQGRSYVMIMTPLYDQTQVRGAVAVIRDMTEERAMDKYREDFIANVSHELRTPISMLQGYSEAIVDDVAESKQEKNELAQIIYEESLRIGRLVNELLDLAKMEAGHDRLNLEVVELSPFVNRVVKKFKGLATDKQVHLELEHNTNLGSIRIDPDRIEQVLTNLIDNAITHTNEEGRVIVEVTSQDQVVQFSIHDTGAGILKDDLPFVFERFYKADKSRKRSKGKKGTGLGLAIAKHIVESHKGSIFVQSKESEGTTFTFKIPKNIETD